MDKVKRFFELKELWKHSSEEERQEVDRQISELMSGLSDAEQEALIDGVGKDFSRLRQEAKDLRITLTVRNRLANVLPLVSVSTIAKDYFGKSTSWFYQRLNGNKVHGKTAAFTEEELIKLSNALKDIADKLTKAASSLTH